MRACVVTFTADQFTAHDIASMLYTAPKEATVRWIQSADFGREVNIGLTCPLFREAKDSPLVSQAVAGLFKVQEDGSRMVAVPWPWDDALVPADDPRRQREALILDDQILFDFSKT